MREIKFRAWDKKYKEMMADVQKRYDFTEYHYEETGEYPELLEGNNHENEK